MDRCCQVLKRGAGIDRSGSDYRAAVSKCDMRPFRFRVVLGFLALVLFGWDYENNRIVVYMEMGWDTGPPMWPYQVVPLLSYAINVPAYIVS